MNRQILREITPAALREVSDGDMEQLLDGSLESLHERLKQAEGDPETEQTLYEQLAERIRETVEQSQEGVRYLEQIGLPDTIANIQAAQQLVAQNYDVYREIDQRRRDVPEEEYRELRQAMKEVPDALEDPVRLQESYDRLGQSMERILEHSYEDPVITGDELKGLKQLHAGMVFQNSMARRHSYDVPLQTGDQVTTMNVTLIQGEDDAGRVQIYMQDMSAEFRISNGEVKGLILCDDRERYEELSGQAGSLVEKLEQAGSPVKNISYTMNHRSRVDAMTAKAVEREPSSSLYRVAKTVVQHVMGVMQQENV